MFAEDIVSLVFARGAFNETAVTLTGGALRGIALGLWAATLGMILLRFLNNAGRNGRAALILASAYAVNALLNLIAWRSWALRKTAASSSASGRRLARLRAAAWHGLRLESAAAALRLLALCVPLAAGMAALCLLVQQDWSGLWAHFWQAASCALQRWRLPLSC